MADRYPSAKVTGIDIAPIQPTVVTRNLRFLLDDINSPRYAENPNTYDLVRICELRGCVVDWPSLVGKYFE